MTLRGFIARGERGLELVEETPRPVPVSAPARRSGEMVVVAPAAALSAPGKTSRTCWRPLEIGLCWSKGSFDPEPAPTKTNSRGNCVIWG